jgi:hypothetical protein
VYLLGLHTSPTRPKPKEQRFHSHPTRQPQNLHIRTSISSSNHHETHPPRSNPRRNQHITLISSTHRSRPHQRSCKPRHHSTVGPTSEEIDCARICKLTLFIQTKQVTDLSQTADSLISGVSAVVGGVVDSVVDLADPSKSRL